MRYWVIFDHRAHTRRQVAEGEVTPGEPRTRDCVSSFSSISKRERRAGSYTPTSPTLPWIFSRKVATGPGPLRSEPAESLPVGHISDLLGE